MRETLIRKVPDPESDSGFTLIEVILAVGIFTFAILALLGLFGSSLRSVGQVESAARVPAVMGAVQAWLDGAEFAEVYGGVAGRGTIVLLVVEGEAASGATGPNGDLRVVRIDGGAGVPEFGRSTGEVFRADLIASPMNPGAGANLPAGADTWPEGYVAVEVSIYTLPAAEPGEALGTYLNRVGAAVPPSYGDRATYDRYHAVTYPAAKPR